MSLTPRKMEEVRALLLATGCHSYLPALLEDGLQQYLHRGPQPSRALKPSPMNSPMGPPGYTPQYTTEPPQVCHPAPKPEPRTRAERWALGEGRG